MVSFKTSYYHLTRRALTNNVKRKYFSQIILQRAEILRLSHAYSGHAYSFGNMTIERSGYSVVGPTLVKYSKETLL